VTYTSPDTTRPTVSITSPTSSTTYPTSSPTVALGGAAGDNVGVTQVRWSNNQGGSGVASGTTSWGISSVPLVSGANVIMVTAVDAAGNSATASLTVTYTVSTPPPTETPAPPPTDTPTPPRETEVKLTAEPRRTERWRATRLTWSNARWSSVDVYRNGMLITNTRNDGFHTDPVWGRGTYTYRICAPGSTTICSNTSTVRY
jgi:hypothetical protein